MNPAFFLLAPLLLAASLPAQDTDGFESTATLGSTITRGNSENTLLTLSLETQRIHGPSDLSAEAALKYGNSTRVDNEGMEETSTTVDNADAKIQYNHLLSERGYGLFNLSARRDAIADIRYRVLAGPGIGRYLLRSPPTLLSIEIGASILTEEVEQRSDNYPVLRAAQKFSHKLNDHAKIWQSLEYLPRASETDAYLLNSTLGVEARLNGNLALRVTLEHRHDSRPDDNSDPDDLTLISGITLSW